MGSSRTTYSLLSDEQDIARIIRDYINKNGYEATITNEGKRALRLMELLNPEFIILDIMLPDIDGIELCRQIRESNNTPILILSARGNDTDKVLGLGFGADDYMTKPFSLNELLARMNAHFRRYESMVNKREDESLLHEGDIFIDKKAYRVRVAGKDISLSAKEFEILFYLIQHKNQVFSKTQLLDAIWGYTTYGDENTITVYIRRLREKIEESPLKLPFQ